MKTIWQRLAEKYGAQQAAYRLTEEGREYVQNRLSERDTSPVLVRQEEVSQPVDIPSSKNA